MAIATYKIDLHCIVGDDDEQICLGASNSHLRLLSPMLMHRGGERTWTGNYTESYEGNFIHPFGASTIDSNSLVDKTF